MLCLIFHTGTENPADDEHRHQIAVEKSTGGSYVVCVQIDKFLLMAYPHRTLTGLGTIFRQSFHTGMAVVTCSPLTAMAWVRLLGCMWDVFHPSHPMPGGFPLDFLPPSEGLEIVPILTIS